MSKSHNHLYKRASYKRARMRAMVRDGFRCQICGCSRFFELTTHHIISLDRGGENSAVNLVTLCRSCHGKVHQPAATPPAELLTAALELLAA